MLSNIILSTLLVSATPQNFNSNWYESTTKLFEFCVAENFKHPICPPVAKSPNKKVSDLPPSGPLTSENLLKATSQYYEGHAPAYWLISLKLGDPKPSSLPRRLWAQAQWLWAKILFDQKRYAESYVLYDQLVPEFQGRALFHQERAWVQFFTGKFDRALGSILSAESPLIYPVPYFEKYFLRGLIERETCHWDEAFNTIAKGREELKAFKAASAKHPFIELCERRQLGPLCGDLTNWYNNYVDTQVKKALDDLDILEVELKDHGVSKQAKAGTATIIWPFVGEYWRDEQGYFSVSVPSHC